MMIPSRTERLHLFLCLLNSTAKLRLLRAPAFLIVRDPSYVVAE